MNVDLLLSGGKVVTASGIVGCDVAIVGERIVGLLEHGHGVEARRVLDVSGRHVLPGVIDPHVHIGLGNGLAEWSTETASAALGGVTTFLSFLMAGTSYLPIIEETRAAAATSAYVDYGLHVVPSTAEHLAEMDAYLAEGICSFKYFTSFRGDEGAYLGVAGTDDGLMFEYFRQVARRPGAIACVHPENIEVVWRLRDALRAAGRDGLAAWAESRPALVEVEAIARSMFFARAAGCPLYLVHVSSALALQEIEVWRRRYPDATVYVETCPHFLTHTSNDPLGSLGKVNPPLRTTSDNDALWSAIASGVVDTIGSDHVARRYEKKTGSIWSASAGFPGTGAILPVLLSEGFHKRGIPLSRIAEVSALNPARIMGLAPRKGALEVGADADVVVVDLEAERKVDQGDFASAAAYTLYQGWSMRGWPVATIVRGTVVMTEGRVVGPPGHGRYVVRPTQR